MVQGRVIQSRIARAVAAAIGIATLAPAVAAAQSRTLGSPLTASPNLHGCETKPTFTEQSSNGDYFPLPSNQPDCTWFQSGVIGSVDYSDPRTGSVPADGRITNVAVRSGPNPTPLRVVIVRQIGGTTGGGHTTACCAFVSETPPAGSPPFQPAPNVVSNFTVEIPVERNVRGTSAVADFVGISGVGAGLLPIADVGDNNTLTGYTNGSPDAGFFYPRMGALEGPGGGTRNNESIPNVEVLLQWTWTPPSAPAPQPQPPTVLPPSAVAAPRGTARVADGRALVKLICNGDAACEGRLELLARGARAAAIKSSKPVGYGKATYAIDAGDKATVKVKLNRKGKRLLRKKKSAKVTLSVAPSGAAATTTPLKLKR